MIFKVIKEELYNAEIGIYTAFGIEMLDDKENKSLAKMSDLFLYAENANKFVFRLNECQPEPVHINELCLSVVEDESVYFKN